MVAYNFSDRFIAPIAEMRKRQTIRKPVRRHARVGELIQLYTAGPAQGRRKIIADPKCVEVTPIQLRPSADFVRIGEEIPINRLNAFAASDGFLDWPDLRDWWKIVYDNRMFEGLLIKWEPSR